MDVLVGNILLPPSLLLIILNDFSLNEDKCVSCDENDNRILDEYNSGCKC